MNAAQVRQKIADMDQQEATLRAQISFTAGAREAFKEVLASLEPPVAPRKDVKKK